MVKYTPPTALTVEAIERARAAENEPRHGYRVPASKINANCLRSIFYGFYWCTPPKQFDGRLLRLFETGNVEEERLISDMRRAGMTVHDTDEDDPEKQIGVAFADGHGYGYLDGEALGVPEAPKKIHVVEFKSHSDKNFKKLHKTQSVAEAFPEHYGQMQIYMHKRGRDRALYLAVNKNDDSLYAERVEYDFKFAEVLESKARRIAFDTTPPPKVANDAESFLCRFCDHKDVCHENEIPALNCRTCIYSKACSGGSWVCNKHGHELDRTAQNIGCGSHLYNPNLINGDQCDANLDEGWIAYGMPGGETWINQEPGESHDTAQAS